jgi:glutamine synthetase
MAVSTVGDVLRLADEQAVRFVLLQFTDILGALKSVAIPVQQLEKALAGEILFDGSSVNGFVRIEESDMLLRPDPATYRMLPWLGDGHGQTARLLCDIATPDGEPFPGCPRSALKRVIAEAEALGFVMNAGPEAEFFIFHLDAEGKPTLKTHDQGSYFDLAPLDKGEDARRDIVIGLQGIGFDVEASHHEVAPAQHEIDFRYADALATADNVVTLKSAVRSLARQRGLCATFMPKPITGIAGSGMHVHQSLFRDGSNAFADPEGEYGLSQLCLNYLGGLLAHARGFTAITNPLINSYKRLIPGYEAPVYIAWSERNRSPLVRVPARRGAGTRLELRNPDGACNPYLALAVMLKAGLDGIRNGLVPPPPVNRNIYLMSDDERRRLGIGGLPARLSDAVDELLADEVIQSALGEHIIRHFVDAKRLETDVYRTQVSQWELEQYLAVY